MMIASLNGTVVEIGADHVVIECAGVGYLAHVAPRTVAALRRGDTARIFTAMVVREDAMTLFGFSDTESRDMFSVLQTVSQIGPKAALGILGTYGPDELASIIAMEDKKSLTRIPGIGPRTADRMILELKDKMASFAGAAMAGTAEHSESAISGAAAQVVVALEGLGFTEDEARRVVGAVYGEQPSLDASAGLRAALGRMGAAG